MKRFYLLMSIALILLALSGCFSPNSDSVEIVNDTYETKSTLSTSNSEYTISFSIEDDLVRVSGRLKSELHKYLLVLFNKDSDSASSIAVTDHEFSGYFELPDEDEVLIELYTGEDEYGSFQSIVLDFVVAEKIDGKWQFCISPVYAHNKSIYDTFKNPDDFLDSEPYIQSDNPGIVSLANSITNGCLNDYEKLRALHDWVAENTYYDYDALLSGDYGEMDAISVINTQKGVCEGYANLFAALSRSLGIPCRVQGGYALGVGEDKVWNSSNLNTVNGNHAWNEAYIDGRWIIIDVTWDSSNKYQGGEYITGEFVRDIYFDSTMEFFSLGHKSFV